MKTDVKVPCPICKAEWVATNDTAQITHAHWCSFLVGPMLMNYRELLKKTISFCFQYRSFASSRT